jgi:hypothetical protein
VSVLNAETLIVSFGTLEISKVDLKLREAKVMALKNSQIRSDFG